MNQILALLSENKVLRLGLTTLLNFSKLFFDFMFSFVFIFYRFLL